MNPRKSRLPAQTHWRTRQGQCGPFGRRQCVARLRAGEEEPAARTDALAELAKGSVGHFPQSTTRTAIDGLRDASAAIAGSARGHTYHALTRQIVDLRAFGVEQLGLSPKAPISDTLYGGRTGRSDNYY